MGQKKNAFLFIVCLFKTHNISVVLSNSSKIVLMQIRARKKALWTSLQAISKSIINLKTSRKPVKLVCFYRSVRLHFCLIYSN